MTAPAIRTVAIFNASHDTVDMLKAILSERGYRVVNGMADDVKSGVLDFTEFMLTHNPDAIIWDIAPPYERNWHFFKLLRSVDLLRSCAIVLTTTHKQHLDSLAAEETGAIEIIGKPYDLEMIADAVPRAIEQLRAAESGVATRMFRRRD